MTDYMRYMELALLDESSDDGEENVSCTCKYDRKDFATLQLTPTVVMQADMLRKVIMRVFDENHDGPTYFQPTERCPPNALVVLINTNEPGPAPLSCAKHHFALSLGNFLRESNTDIFLEEFFCEKRRTRVNHADDSNFTKRRRRGASHECNVRDVLLKAHRFHTYNIDTTGKSLIRTKVRPATISAEWRSVVALSCCSAMTTDQEETLTRVTIVDVSKSKVIFDTFVKQTVEVADYRTKETGITCQDMKYATRTHEQVRAEVLESYIFGDTIVVGQGIGNDLRLLGVHHTRVVEINNIYPRRDRGEPYGYSLKLLSPVVLNRPIAMRFVDAVENTLVIADLLKEKIRNGLGFGLDLKIVEAPAASGNPLCRQLVEKGVEILLHCDSKESSTKIWLENVEHNVLQDGPHMQRFLDSKDKHVFTLSHLSELGAGMGAQELAAEILLRQKENFPLTILVFIGDESHSVFFA
ncbi:ribonuclease H70 [Perkinsela sp. CCAP 1560/4]|nr:ribonuclease H70 [Perkinsela sp. CCAP 1560/4]KNH09042.1 ribonuclease H70 [Perkinsela sp. CCAP 1560/4]|eukprot:KNH03832.1 ribonuclease H70 [Perkinsela sp. CCAP 1560/4]